MDEQYLKPINITISQSTKLKDFAKACDSTNSNMSMIKLCSKLVKTGKQQFTSYFGYIAMPDGELAVKVALYKTKVTNEVTKTTKEVMLPHSYRIHFAKDSQADKFIKEYKGSFPLIIMLRDPICYKDTEASYFITTDKDKDGKVRLDKNGKSHDVLIINKLVELVECPKIVKSLSTIDE